MTPQKPIPPNVLAELELRAVLDAVQITDNPTVLDVRDRMVVVAKLAHGEAIAKSFRNTVESWQPPSEWQAWRRAIFGTYMLICLVIGTCAIGLVFASFLQVLIKRGLTILG